MTATTVDSHTRPERSGLDALVAQGVGLTINGVTILNDISFALGEGEVIGLIGPNGAGKTSLINVLSGITPPTSGQVTLLQEDVTKAPPHRRARAGLGRTFQTSNLYGGLTVADNVRLAVQAQRPGLLSSLGLARTSSDAEERAAAALGRVGLDGRAGALASGLSHGDKRKLELAMVLATGSQVLLLDEPMAGVNTEDVPGLIALIAAIRNETGASILIVEHHMNVVLGLSDRVAVLHHGALLAIDRPEVVMKDPTVQSAYIGDAL